MMCYCCKSKWGECKNFQMGEQRFILWDAKQFGEPSWIQPLGAIQQYCRSYKTRQTQKENWRMSNFLGNSDVNLKSFA